MRKGGGFVVVRIHNSKGNNEQLVIPKDCWQRAVKKERLTYSEFCLYLYLASHEDNEVVDLALEKFEKDTGYKKTSYNDAIRTLRKKGFLTQIYENRYEFHLTPLRIDGEVPQYMFGED